MTEEKKKEFKPEGSYSVKVRPVEYEAKGLFLKTLLNAEFAKKLSEGIGDFQVINFSIYAEKEQDVITLWHKRSEDSKEGIVTIMVKKEGLKEALFNALGVEK